MNLVCGMWYMEHILQKAKVQNPDGEEKDAVSRSSAPMHWYIGCTCTLCTHVTSLTSDLAIFTSAPAPNKLCTTS